MPTIKDIKAMAKARNIKISGKARKADMIHILQEQEGNNPCYATRICTNDVCLWFEDCQKAMR